jgi:hypothetical protein
MSGVTFNDLETYGMLKELYSDDVAYQDHVQNSLYAFCRHAGAGEIEFDGNNWNQPVQFSLNESYAALNDGEHLPDSDFPKGVFAKYRVKLTYGTIEATTFAATRGHKGGRPNGKYLDDQIKSSFMSFLSNRDFDLYGNGRGLRATIATATPAAASFTCSSTMGCRAGMKFDWYDSTYAVKRGSIKVDIKGVDRVNRRVYIDSTFGTAQVPAGAVAGDVLVVYGALAPNEPTDGRYPAGLARLVDNTLSLGGLAPSTYALWQATNLNAGGANPSQEFLQQHLDTMYVVSGINPSKLVINPAWKRQYLSQFLNQRRFTTNSFDTGASTVTFSPVKMGEDEKGKKPGRFDILEDKNAPADRYYMFNSDAFACAYDYSDAPHLADEDEREFRFRLGFDSMQGFLRFWWNTVTKQRNAMGVGYNFATATGVL